MTDETQDAVVTLWDFSSPDIVYGARAEVQYTERRDQDTLVVVRVQERPNDLNLADVLHKHLERHLSARAGMRQRTDS